MRVRDLRVQRSRERHTNAIRDPNFRNRLIGKDYHDLRGFLTNSNATVDTARLQVSRDAERIAHTAVLSGVKAIVITNIAFSGPVLKARLLGNTHRFFPATVKVTEIRSPFNGEAVAAVERLTGHAPRELDRESFKILRALDGEGHTRGILVFSRWSAHPTSPELWWAVAPDGVLEQVVLVGDVEAETTRTFSSLQGKKLTELAAANSPSTVSAVKCGTDVLAVLTTHGIGE